MSRRRALGEVALVFLKLGVTAFGGPAAHVAMMEAELVRRRRWVTHERFLDLLGAANLVPGPSSTELAIFLGWERAGAAGLALAGACFITPAALMVGALAWAYVRFGALPELSAAMHGIKPVVIAVIAQALWGLAPKAIKGSVFLGGLAVVAAIASALGADPLLVLAGAGIAALVLRGGAPGASAVVGVKALTAPAALGAGAAGTAGALAKPGLGAIFLAFLKVGATVFGSGYVLLALLRADLVLRLQWLPEPALVDAVAVGQVTPGPVFTTATFLGYLLGGPKGAAVATVAIFLPGFAFVAAARPLVARVRASPRAGAFLDGVNVASLALMAVVGVQLARAAVTDALTLALALASAVALVRFKTNATWLVLGGAAAGVLARLAGLS